VPAAPAFSSSPSSSSFAPADTGLPGRVRSLSTVSVRTRYRRQTAALAVATTVIGLWLGLAAPSVSPVTPTTPPVALAPADPGPGATAPRTGDGRVARDAARGRDGQPGRRG
jgi:hypothetical protein